MTENANINRKCEKCGSPLAPDAPEGLCPRCLMALNLATQTEAPTGEIGPDGTKVAPPKPEPSAAAAGLAPNLEFLTPAQRESLEKLSLNLARAAMTAQGAIAEAALRQADRPSALTPDPFHVAPALTEVMARLTAQPDRLMRAQADLFTRYMDLWKVAAQRATGETAAEVASPASTASSHSKSWPAKRRRIHASPSASPARRKPWPALITRTSSPSMTSARPTACITSSWSTWMA